MMDIAREDFSFENLKRERMYHINEIEDLMIIDNRNKPNQLFQILKNG